MPTRAAAGRKGNAGASKASKDKAPAKRVPKRSFLKSDLPENVDDVSLIEKTRNEPRKSSKAASGIQTMADIRRSASIADEPPDREKLAAALAELPASEPPFDESPPPKPRQGPLNRFVGEESIGESNISDLSPPERSAPGGYPSKLPADSKETIMKSVGATKSNATQSSDSKGTARNHVKGGDDVSRKPKTSHLGSSDDKYQLPDSDTSFGNDFALSKPDLSVSKKNSRSGGSKRVVAQVAKKPLPVSASQRTSRQKKDQVAKPRRTTQQQSNRQDDDSDPEDADEDIIPHDEPHASYIAPTEMITSNTRDMVPSTSDRDMGVVTGDEVDFVTVPETKQPLKSRRSQTTSNAGFADRSESTRESPGGGLTATSLVLPRTERMSVDRSPNDCKVKKNVCQPRVTRFEDPAIAKGKPKSDQATSVYRVYDSSSVQAGSSSAKRVASEVLSSAEMEPAQQNRPKRPRVWVEILQNAKASPSSAVFPNSVSSASRNTHSDPFIHEPLTMREPSQFTQRLMAEESHGRNYHDLARRTEPELPGTATEIATRSNHGIVLQSLPQEFQHNSGVKPKPLMGRDERIAERDPLPMAEDAVHLCDKWKASTEACNKSIGETMHDITNALLRHIKSKEAALGDVATAYGKKGDRIIDKTEKAREIEKQKLVNQLVRRRDGLITVCRRASAATNDAAAILEAADLENIHMEPKQDHLAGRLRALLEA